MEENKMAGTPETEPRLFKMPKNIRQIGQGSEQKRVYVEDYVMTYIKQLSAKADASGGYGVLLGQYVTCDEVKNIFISGLVEIKEEIPEDRAAFSNDVWTGIYEDIKRYFTEVEIVGWCRIGAGIPLEPQERSVRLHMENFTGRDRVMLLYESLDKEEAFYVFDGSSFRKQHGYYIYYEKNEEMQSYMIARKAGGVREEAGYEDKAVREIRRVVEKRKPSVKKTVTGGILYAIGTAAAAVVLVLGSYTLSNYDRMKGIEQTLDTISNHLVTGGSEKTKAPGSSPAAPAEKPDPEPVTGAQMKESGETPGPEQTPELSPEPELPSTAPSPEPDEVSAPPKEDSQASAGVHRYYIVEEGDTLLTISRKIYQTTERVEEIRKLNKIKDQNMILVGQKIILPD